MKEYLVVFAQLLAVGWLLRTLSKARGRLDEEELGWFDIRLGSKPPKPGKGGKPPGHPLTATKAPVAREGRGPHA